MHRLPSIARLAAIPALWLAAACSPGFESGSRLQSLRVLAVQKDKPYARPGDTITLRMLLDDAGDSAPRKVTVAWFSGCEDPEGDLYAGCFLGRENADAGGGLPGGHAGAGPEFSFSVSPDIISRRPRPADKTQPPYGVAYVFFAVCAGEIRPVTPTADSLFPLGCFSSKGEQLGPDDFVAGYTQVFVYESITNANPIVSGFEYDGKSVEPECFDEACIPLEREELGLPPLGGSEPPDAGFTRIDAGAAADAGLRPVPDAGATSPGDANGVSDAGVTCSDGDPHCIDVCSPVVPDSCRKRNVKLVVDEKSAEVDELQASRDGRPLEEQMWVNYYTSRGKLEHDVKLQNDSTTGWNAKSEAQLLPPVKPGPFHVWAVVHDNRGGAAWARVRFVARNVR